VHVDESLTEDNFKEIAKLAQENVAGFVPRLSQCRPNDSFRDKPNNAETAEFRGESADRQGAQGLGPSERTEQRVLQLILTANQGNATSRNSALGVSTSARPVRAGPSAWEKRRCSR
jgi:hypothetical protein